jgi:hypothetical protein
MGEPKSDREKYLTGNVRDVNIYYPPNLKPKNGFSEIRIRTKNFLFFTWLELEGAKAIVVAG